MIKDFYPRKIKTVTNVIESYWFIFNNYDILIGDDGDGIFIPFVKYPQEINNSIRSFQYIGEYRSVQCFCAVIADDKEKLIPGFNFISLRNIFGKIDDGFFRVACYAYEISVWDRTFAYCSRCGEKNHELDIGWAKSCPSCGLISYPRISPAIIVAVIRNNKLLLARSPGFKNGMYSVLAGFVDPGESLEDCVIREVKEEVQINVRNIRYFSSQSWSFTNSLMVGFIADYESGEIKVDGDEIIDAGWFSKSEIPLIPEKISIARKLIDWFVDNC